MCAMYDWVRLKNCTMKYLKACNLSLLIYFLYLGLKIAISFIQNFFGF